MNRKKIAFESALIALALVVAFVVQLILSHTKPPKLPDFERSSDVSVELETDIELATGNVDTADSEIKVPIDFQSNLSSLGLSPDWSELDRFQRKVSREQFVTLLTGVYVKGDFWNRWFEVQEDYVDIQTSAQDPSQTYRVYFQNDVEGGSQTQGAYWRSREQIRSAGQLSDSTLPLRGVKLAIDPGHIGGAYAQVEQRKFVLSEEYPPVQEGDMTLLVAEKLQYQLETLGADVSLVRVATEPVNPFTADDYLEYAKLKLESQGALLSQLGVKSEAERLFYRNGEIRARANLINDVIQPDVVLCLHFNAAGQADPDAPELLDREHFHILLNGAYTEPELANDDERFQCVLKILENVFSEEIKLSSHLVTSFVGETGLPAYEYSPGSLRAVKLSDDAFVWGRNLLANRLYDCPVIFFEPYLMNGADSFPRMQIGDYEGLRYVNGKLRPSIYREYVDAVVRGLVNYYTEQVSDNVTIEQPRVPNDTEGVLEEGVGASGEEIVR